MQKNITCILMNRLVGSVLCWLILTTAQAAGPLWTIRPAPGNNPTQTVAENQTATVQYIVQNQSAKPKRLVIQSILGITSTNPCRLTPRGQVGSSCTLNLVITGSALPRNGIHGGPILCLENPDGSPNPNQCYQPSAANSLNITRGPAVGPIITVNPSSLNFVAGSNGVVTVTNSPTSSEPVNNLTVTIPAGSNISVQSTTCGASLAVGASCTISFTTPAAEGPTNITINSSNANTMIVVITVNAIPMATLNVTPTTLLFAENSTGDITVTNNAGSPVAADNVAATIPGGSNISVQSSTCGASLAIGASCIITFASSTQEGPTTIPIAGDNTNTVNVDVTVTSQPQISITNPIQQARVVAVSGVALSLEVTNDAGSAVNANAITVTNNAACPNLSVDDADCASVAPGDSCTLELTSNTPYAPCTIIISGSNTANSPQALIAFSYLGGLVFEESAGSGKVVIDAAQGFDSSWTSSYADITGATSLTDGVANTNAIVADPSCSGDTANCAAQLCRNISADWYFPARNELVAIHSALCANAATPCNFGDFSSSIYWSSSQNDFSLANYVDFPSGSTLDTDKILPFAIRCIRGF